MESQEKWTVVKGEPRNGIFPTWKIMCGYVEIAIVQHHIGDTHIGYLKELKDRADLVASAPELKTENEKLKDLLKQAVKFAPDFKHTLPVGHSLKDTCWMYDVLDALTNWKCQKEHCVHYSDECKFPGGWIACRKAVYEKENK